MIIISIHIFPHEIKNFERIVENLKVCLTYVNSETDIQVNASLNLNDNVVDKCKYDKNDTIKTFLSCEKKLPIKTDFRVMTTSQFYGVNEERRNTIQVSTNSDVIIFLDSDLYFNDKILAHQINSIDIVSKLNKFFIISPQVVKLWDTTWDCIVNELYINESFTLYKKINPQKTSQINYGKPSVISCDTFKWGGGWFNAISANLLKLIGIPESFKGYGPDDTFIMECCKYMKSKNLDVQQYILKNMVVVEDRFYPRQESSLRDDNINFRENSNKHFHTELNFFKKKINDNIYNNGL